MWQGQLLMAAKSAQYGSNVKNEAEKEKKKKSTHTAIEKTSQAISKAKTCHQSGHNSKRKNR